MNTDFGLKGSADISRSVIGAAFRVANCLGVGFLEKVYENALSPIHKAQCLNYLRAARLHTGLVINFGHPRLEIYRILS